MTQPDRSIALPGQEETAEFLAHLQITSDDFKALLRRYGRPAPALRHFGLIQWTRADTALAIEAFRAALAFAPEDGETWRDLASAYDAAGEADSALSCVRRSLELNPDDARAWQMIAGLDNRRGARENAELSFRRALDLDPTLGDAHFGLGLLCFEDKRLDEAVDLLQRAVAYGYDNALGHGLLGHVLYLAGRFSDCAAAFETAARFGPLDPGSLRKFARARTFETIIAGRLDQAIDAYVDLAGSDAEDIADILRDAFAVLSGYGHSAAALTVGRLRMARNPGDVVQRYLLDAVRGEALTRAPIDYLERHFDGFAATFDNKLVDVLRYKVPADMASLVAGTKAIFEDVLDLGCGTGLAASHLAPFGGRLTGVDISAGMLAEAAKRGLYGDLVKSEIVDYLCGREAGFDLIFAADVLIYFGDMRPFFDGAAQAARPGGLVAMSVETGAQGDYLLKPSGRFAHSADYLERLAKPHFTILAQQAVTIRLEAGRPAEGLILLLERRSHD